MNVCDVCKVLFESSQSEMERYGLQTVPCCSAECARVQYQVFAMDAMLESLADSITAVATSIWRK